MKLSFPVSTFNAHQAQNQGRGIWGIYPPKKIQNIA